MPVPRPTPIYRIIHVDNLHICLRRGGLHAPNHAPDDGLEYKTIHDVGIQRKRHIRNIPCGPGGVMHDYVSFYFGHRSPMLLRLHTDRVEGYREGQRPIIYLVSTAQAVRNNKTPFVFSDGQGIASFTRWLNRLKDLSEVDWEAVYARYWGRDVDDMDRQRRKQAEFLIHKSCDWSLIQEIGVVDCTMKQKAEDVMKDFPRPMRRPVRVHSDWYY